jgi:hypothetical protein
MGKLNLISNFLQEFVVRPLPFARQSKSNAPEVKTQSPPAAATPSRKQSLERALSTAQLPKKRSFARDYCRRAIRLSSSLRRSGPA